MKPRLLAAILIATSLARTASAAPRPLRDSLPPGAKQDYLEGRILYEDGDAAGALVKFEQAYAASKDPRLLWNEAVCEKSQRHYANVRALLARYLQDGGDRLTSADRKEAAELADAIEPFTVAITLRVSEPDALVLIDGRAVGTTPLAAPVVVDIGVRRIEVRKGGFRAWDQAITLGEKRTAALDVALARAEGRLEVSAPPFAAVTVDDRPVGVGSVALTLPVGGHVLRVTQRGRRPYQTEVVIEDERTHSVSVRLEMEAGRGERTAELHVAVGCGDATPRSFADGMTLDIDGERQTDAEVVMGYSEEERRPIVDFLRVPVRPGKHRVLVAIPDCDPDVAQTMSSDEKPGILRGALARSKDELLRGPAGTPDRFRVAVGGLVHVTAGSINANNKHATAAPFVGAIGSAGFVTRWFVALADFGISAGDLHIDGQDPQTAQHFLLRARAGFRAPFHSFAVNVGVGAAFDSITSTSVSGGSSPLWAAFDVQPFCDWLMPIAVTYSSPTDTKGLVSFEVGLAYQPNRVCRRDRSTVHGL
jgi:hypothetical protein